MATRPCRRPTRLLPPRCCDRATVRKPPPRRATRPTRPRWSWIEPWEWRRRPSWSGQAKPDDASDAVEPLVERRDLVDPVVEHHGGMDDIPNADADRDPAAALGRGRCRPGSPAGRPGTAGRRGRRPRSRGRSVAVRRIDTGSPGAPPCWCRSPPRRVARARGTVRADSRSGWSRPATYIGTLESTKTISRVRTRSPRASGRCRPSERPSLASRSSASAAG